MFVSGLTQSAVSPTFERTQIRNASYHPHNFHFQPLCSHDPASFPAPVWIQAQVSLTPKSGFRLSVLYWGQRRPSSLNSSTCVCKFSGYGQNNAFHLYPPCVCVCGWVGGCSITFNSVALQASLSMEFSRQEYWSGLPFPPLGDLSYPGIKPTSLALADVFIITARPGKTIPIEKTVCLVFTPAGWIHSVWLFACIDGSPL